MNQSISLEQANNNISARIWLESNSPMGHGIVIEDLRKKRSVINNISQPLLTKRSPLLHWMALQCLHWQFLITSS